MATDIREKSEIPQLEHIRNFVRTRVKAEFDSDFGYVLRWTLQETPAFEERIEEEFIQIRRPQENPQNATFVRQSTESMTTPL